ncbi:MAG TPA: TolC family protein [Anaeromyxobacteraceae bacterium]
MRSKLIPTLLALALSARAAASGEPAPATAAPDPTLEALVRESLERSPEYSRADAAVKAERERIPQAGALPDPTLTLGIQNDGFNGIQVGKMETSFYQVMVTQPFPWPGKRGSRERAAEAQASVVNAQLERIRLSTAAEVERAYVDLLLVRGQLELQARLETLWKEAETMARTRYEVGAGPQSDLIRAQLERTRLQQQRIALETTERTRVQTLNRLRVHPLDEPIPTDRKLSEGGDPAPSTVEEAMADAERRSPDLAQAHLSVLAAQRRVEVAKRDRFPDLSVTAGIMPRGQLDPMWLASVGITLPIFSGSKQSRAVAESARREESEVSGEEATRQVVRLRAQERQTLLAALTRTNTLYRSAVLVQSEAAVRSTLAQYQVGKVTFQSVLDVLRGLVADENGYLASLAEARRVAIAQREVSLDAPAGLGGGVASGTIPGAGAMGGGGRGGKGSAATGGQEQAAPTSASGGGMSSGM